MSEKYDSLTHSLRSSASPGGKRDFWDLQYRSKWKTPKFMQTPRFKSYSDTPKSTLQSLLGKKLNFPMGGGASISIGRFNQRVPTDVEPVSEYSPGGELKYENNPMYGIKFKKRF